MAWSMAGISDSYLDVMQTMCLNHYTSMFYCAINIYLPTIVTQTYTPFENPPLDSPSKQ